MRIRDELGVLFHDCGRFPAKGQPAEAPARLALVTLLQFMEGLTDRQAADAANAPGSTGRTCSAWTSSIPASTILC